MQLPMLLLLYAANYEVGRCTCGPGGHSASAERTARERSGRVTGHRPLGAVAWDGSGCLTCGECFAFLTFVENCTILFALAKETWRFFLCEVQYGY